MKKITLTLSFLMATLFALPLYADENDNVTIVSQPEPYMITDQPGTTYTTMTPEGDVTRTTIEDPNSENSPIIVEQQD